MNNASTAVTATAQTGTLQAAELTPKEIVQELDRHIIGQTAAKRAVAVALRNRWRRMQVTEPLRQEITPKNILMIGTTGVGKTEIARRLAKLVNAPFVKVEATKFTEVGYVGRDVESIIKELVDISVKLTREQEMAKVHEAAAVAAETRVLDTMYPQLKRGGFSTNAPISSSSSEVREKTRAKIRAGALDDTEIEFDVKTSPGFELQMPHGMEEMQSQLQAAMVRMNKGQTKPKKMRIADALKYLTDEEAGKLINEESLKARALANAEQNGIVFINEIDKVTRRGETTGVDVSREGVQRDLLPLIEGCTVFTKHGTIKTDHILFIVSGAFHLSKPSDLIPELQGRLPIRVNLESLTEADFVRILTEPTASLTTQYTALLATEGFTVEFKAEGVRTLAKIAFHVNERTENIGARRLHTVMEKLLEAVSFDATELKDSKLVVDEEYVNKTLGDLVKDEDLSRFIL